MKIIFVVLVCALWEARGYPYPYPYYGSNVDSISYGSLDSNRGGVALSRYYNPYYSPRAYGGGMAAFMFRPEDRYQPQTSQYYSPDRRRQTQPENFPQQNEVYNYPQTSEQSERFPEQPVLPENPAIPEIPTITEATEIVEPTERTELGTTTLKTVIPESTEPESEEVPKPISKKRVSKKKQAKRPVEEDDDENDEYPRMPTGAYFPMFFGWGGKSNNGAPGGATAIANAFSTGRGGVATSHATAYGPPSRPEIKRP